MRVILTLIAVALVTLLTAALIVPMFIDWSAHRAEIAERLEGLTGGRVTLTGPVTLRLLPTPFIEVGAGSAVGGGANAATVSFEGARLELALVKLASGAFRFTDVRLEKPVLTLNRRADGALALPAAAKSRAAGVGFDRFAIDDGTIVIAGAPERRIEGVQIEGDATTLAGPYHVTGRLAGPGGAPVAFRLVSEAAGPSGAPVRLVVEAGAAWPALEFDGTAAVGPKGPSAVGAAVIAGATAAADGATPWRVSGRLAADLDGATLSSADLRFGPDERAVRGEGTAALAWRETPRFSVDAKVKQANLDALLRRKGEDGVPPARAAAFLSAALSPALESFGSGAIDAKLAVTSAILGGDTVTGFAASLRGKPGQPLGVSFDLGLPGQSRVRGEGVLESGAAAKFAGPIDVSTENAAALARWAGQGAPELAAWAVPLGDSLADTKLGLSGDAEASRVGFSGKALAIALGRSVLTGSLAVTRPVGADPGRIFADLAADTLAVEALPNLAETRGLIEGYDLSLRLEARALSVAHVGEAGVEGAALSLALAKTGATTTLERLSLTRLGGASLEATGLLAADGGAASGRLSADKLADFAALVARLAPGPWSRMLVQRAALLSPASIAFDARTGPLVDGAPPLEALKATGSLGGAAVALKLDPTPQGGQRLALTLESPDSAALLRQLGLASGGAPAGPGRVDLHAAGAWSAGFDLDAAAALAGASLSGRGRWVPLAEGDDARLFGSVKLGGDNLAPLAALLGLAPPGAVIGPVDGSADVTLRGERWSLSRIAASIAGVKASGALGYAPLPPAPEAPHSADVALAEEAVNGPAAAVATPPPAALTGELAFDRLRLADLLGLALGPPQAGADGPWSKAKFRPPPLTPPSAAVRVKAGALTLAEGLAAQGFSAMLRLDRGRLDLDDVALRLAGAGVAGRATLRRSGETATLDGAVTAEPQAVKRQGFAGRIGGRLEFASTGKSAAALVAGLAGGGTAEVSGAAMPRSDPGALDATVAAAQAQDADIDEAAIAKTFTAALDKGPLSIPDGPTPIALTGGAIKAGPIAIPRPRGAGSLAANFDLARMALDTRLQLASPSTGLAFWSGPPPAATVTIANALDAPERRIDIASLAAGLATQAIARESERIAILEADIRERAFFNRRLKGERFMDRRKAEIEDWRAEQERLRGIAQHLVQLREEARIAEEKAAVERAAAEKAAAAAAEAARKMAAERKAAPDTIQGEPTEPDSADSDPDSALAGAPNPPRRPKGRARPTPNEDPTPGSLY